VLTGARESGRIAAMAKRRLVALVGGAVLLGGAGLFAGTTALSWFGDFDVYALPGMNRIFGFDKLAGEEARLKRLLACDRTASDRVELTARRFTCAFGDRVLIQVFVEDLPSSPGTVRRVVFSWRTKLNPKDEVEPRSIAERDRGLAVEAVRALAKAYVPGEEDRVVDLLGLPASGVVARRGMVATYARLTDPEGERLLVEFRDATSRQLSARAGADDEAGRRVCAKLIGEIPDFAHLKLRGDLRGRQEEGMTVYIMAAEDATFICEFYQTGYYRLIRIQQGSEDQIVVAHGMR